MLRQDNRITKCLPSTPKHGAAVANSEPLHTRRASVLSIASSGIRGCLDTRSPELSVQACGLCHSDSLTKEGHWPGIPSPEPAAGPDHFKRSARPRDL